VLGFLDSIPDDSSSYWEGFVIYTGHIKKIRLGSPAQFEYLSSLLFSVDLNMVKLHK